MPLSKFIKCKSHVYRTAREEFYVCWFAWCTRYSYFRQIKTWVFMIRANSSTDLPIPSYMRLQVILQTNLNRVKIEPV